MSAGRRSGPQSLALAIPDAWQAFLSSGEYARAQASVHAGGAEGAFDLVARLEFADDRNLAIHLVLAKGASSPPDTSGRLVQLLTARERAVIALIAMGYNTDDIGRTLYISPSTVRTHVRNAMSKLGARTRAQLVAVAMDADATSP